MQNIHVFLIFSHILALSLRLLQDDFASCNYWALPKDRTQLWSVFASVCVAIFHSSPRKLPALCKYFLEFTLLLSFYYSWQLHWQILFAEIWDWKQEVLSPHESLFVLICILSCLTIDSAVSIPFFFNSVRNFSAVLCFVGVQQQSLFCSTVWSLTSSLQPQTVRYS